MAIQDVAEVEAAVAFQDVVEVEAAVVAPIHLRLQVHLAHLCFKRNISERLYIPLAKTSNDQVVWQTNCKTFT